MKLKNVIISTLLCMGMGISALTAAANGDYDPFYGREMLYQNDFAGFVSGGAGMDGCTFVNDAKNGGTAGERIDSFHGTSLKIADLTGIKDNYHIGIFFELKDGLASGKYMFEFEVYPVSELTSFWSLAPLNSNSDGGEILSVFGRNVKAAGRYDDAGNRGELILGKWNKIRILFDMDNKKYAVYLNGKQIDDVKDLSILNAVTRMFISTYPIDNVNHGDIYLDNVCLYKIDNEPDKDVAAWSVAVGQSGDLSVLFADDIDPALINKNNIALYKDGKKLAFTITEKSAFGFALNPKEELKDGEYELTLDNVFGSGGQKLAEDTIRLRNTAGTYQYITDKQDYLTLEVTGNTITVINKTGSVKSYVLLTGYYKDGVLHHMSSVKGISEASEIRKNYSVLAKDGYEIRAFIFDRELSDIYFN